MNTGEFWTYQHDEAGFTLPVHGEWTVLDGAPGCALVAVEPWDEPPQQCRANLVVTVERLAEEQSLDAWVESSRETLTDGRFNRLQIFDTEETEISGLPARRTLSHYLHHEAGGVNLEQWAVAFEGWGYVVSATTSALDYDLLADFMWQVAEGLRIHHAPSVDQSEVVS